MDNPYAEQIDYDLTETDPFDLETCPICWYTWSHDNGCQAAQIVSYEDLEPHVKGIIL